MVSGRPNTYKNGLLWFTNDLRLHDNATLINAVATCERLVCVYVLDKSWFAPDRYNVGGMVGGMGPQRWRFLDDSVKELKRALELRGQELLVLFAHPVEAIGALIEELDIDAVFRSNNAGFNEQRQWRVLKERFSACSFLQSTTHTIFEQSALPFQLSELPGTFSQFRRRTQRVEFRAEQGGIKMLPPPPTGIAYDRGEIPPQADVESPFHGGMSSGQQQLARYFRSSLPSAYKEDRNALDGWDNSTKLSPWLANGCISPREVISRVQEYEAKNGANDSTRHIIVELLWREYFQWYAHAHGVRLFLREGITGRQLLTSFYPERYKRWCSGTTPYPLVNACMRELSETGYMSNRGRQIVASCLVNELALDWRYGAAWFEQKLIDYDVAANWGNWQYIAGVGADPRQGRHFDIRKQAKIYDPQGVFVNTWMGAESMGALDSRDAADWPIM